MKNKTLPVSLRLPPEVRLPLRRREDDDRSLSSMMERIIKQWLMENG